MSGFNAGSYLSEAARRDPEGRALLVRDRVYTFAELERRAQGYARDLARRGMGRGQVALIFVPPGAEFVALVFALFRLGAVPALLDPGMGIPAMLRCIARLEPDALLGIPRAHFLRLVSPSAFRTVRCALAVGASLPGVPALTPLEGEEVPLAPTHPRETAAILFTSGSTGPAKGVVYRHEVFRAQVEALGKLYGFRAGEVDMAGFPLFALFSVAFRMTCCVPRLDPSRPAGCDPALLVEDIRRHRVTSLQGSPAIWSRVADYCLDRGIRLPAVRRVLTFGCPIPPELIRKWRRLLPEEGEVYTPYGATEALPVSSIAGREVLEETAAGTAGGRVVCVGRPTPGASVRILEGEVVVSGPMVTWSYHRAPEASARAKIRDEEGRIWHRMGDAGAFDDRGRLWRYGRTEHGVRGRRAYYPVCAEGIFNRHKRVRRSALVGVGGEPVLVVQPRSGWAPRSREERERLSAQILRLGADHPIYREVRIVLFRQDLPVDRRHNAKIHRDELARWARRSLRGWP